MSLFVDALEYRIGNFTILDRIVAEAHLGEVIGVVGPNGSGKSTLANIICGALRPSSGQVRLNDRVLTEMSPWEIAECGVSRMFQEQHLAWNLTVLENLLAAADAAHGIRKWSDFIHLALPCSADGPYLKNAKRMANRLGLLAQQHTLVRNVSFGQQRLVALGVALLQEGTCVILDEPFAELHSDVVRTILGLIREEQRQRIWLVIDHSLLNIRNIADRIWYMQSGQLTSFDNFHSMEISELFRSSYLGLDGARSSISSPAVPRLHVSPTEREENTLPSGAPLLRVCQLTAGYEGRNIINEISFDLFSGEVLCLIGRNGSGKSTLLRAIVGIISEAQGHISLGDVPIERLRPDERIRLGIRLLPQDGRIMRSLSIRDNLTISAGGLINSGVPFHGSPLWANHAIKNIVQDKESVLLRNGTLHPNQRAGTLSGGQQSRLAINELQFGIPRVFLLDEPTAGADGLARLALVDFVLDATSCDAAVVVVEHDLEFVSQVASRVAVMANTKLVELEYTRGDSPAKMASTLLSMPN